MSVEKDWTRIELDFLRRQSNRDFLKWLEEKDMERAKIDPAYNQPTDMANEGTRQQAGKDSMNPCDAKGDPNHFTRNQTTLAVPEHDVKELRDKQLGSNAGMCAGFNPESRSYSTVAPLRGFKNDK